MIDRLDLDELRADIKKHIDQEQRQHGELVMVLITSDPATGSSKKLYPKFKGPFRVHKVLINDRYEVEDL